jgi:hypothetical protein
VKVRFLMYTTRTFSNPMPLVFLAAAG